MSEYKDVLKYALGKQMADAQYNSHLARIAEERNPEQRNYHLKNLAGQLMNEGNPIADLLLNHLNTYKHDTLPYMNDDIPNPSVTRKLTIDPHTKVMLDKKDLFSGKSIPFAHLQLHYRSPQQNMLDRPIVTIPIPFTKDNLHDFLDKHTDNEKYSQLKHWAIRTFGDKTRNDE